LALGRLNGMTDYSASFRLPGGEDLDQALLERYWFGEISPQETAVVEAWLAEHPEWHAWYEQLRYRLKEGDWVALSDAEVDCTVRRVLDETQIRRKDGVSQARPVRPSLQRGMDRAIGAGEHQRAPASKRIALYAFASIIVVVLGIFLGRHTQSSSFATRADTAPLIYTTGKGQRANITLSDGSTVVLSVDSRLEVPVDYSRGHRALRLTGEALFSVVHRPKSAFTVMSGNVTTHVLGTSFVVRHYPSDTSTMVAVRDGKVGVRTLVLAAGQQSDVRETGIPQVRTADPARFTFATGVLTLEDMPLRDAAVELSRWYDLDIRLGDSTLATQTVWGGFAAGAQSDMIAMFERVMNLRVVRDGRAVTLFSRSSR
jgi:ferric-dicitrate binding protein FerR (iron transport regulator)